MNKTPFEQDIDTLGLTYAEVKLIKQMILQHIIGDNWPLIVNKSTIISGYENIREYEYKVVQNKLSDTMRERLGQL